MYAEDDKVDFVRRSNFNREAHLAATAIQKCYRGHICRKILKEKMRIDREFRILR